MFAAMRYHSGWAQYVPTTVSVQFQAEAGVTILRYEDNTCPVDLELGQAQRKRLRDMLAGQVAQVEQGGGLSRGQDLRVLAHFKVGPKWHETDPEGARVVVASVAAEGRDWVGLSVGRVVSASERLISYSPRELLLCPDATRMLMDVLAQHSSLFAQRGSGDMGDNAQSSLAEQSRPREAGP